MVYVGVHLLMPDRTRRKDLTALLNMHNKIRLRRCPLASIVTNGYQDWRCILHCNTNFQNSLIHTQSFSSLFSASNIASTFTSVPRNRNSLYLYLFAFYALWFFFPRFSCPSIEHALFPAVSWCAPLYS